MASEGLITDQKSSTPAYDVLRDRVGFGFEFRSYRTGPGSTPGTLVPVGPGVGKFADINALAAVKLVNGARAFMTDIGAWGSWWRVANSIWYPEGPILHNATPEAAITAPIGSLCTRSNGGATTTLYVKESGTGNTGWVAK